MHQTESFIEFQLDLFKELEVYGVGASMPAFLELNVDPQDTVLEVRRYVGDSTGLCISKTWCLYVYRDQDGELTIGADNRELHDLSFGPALTDDEIRRRAKSIALPFSPAHLKDLRVTEGVDAFCLDCVLAGASDDGSEVQTLQILLGTDSCVVVSDPLPAVPGVWRARNELSPIEIAELADIVSNHRAYADNASEDDLRRFREELAAWRSAPLWVGKRAVAVGEQIKVLFSDGEKSCTELRFARPYREGAGHVLSPIMNETPAWCYERATLADLISTRPGIQALYRRLDEDCVAPYGGLDSVVAESKKGTLVFQTVWAWENDVTNPTALLCAPTPDVPNGPQGEFPVVIPVAWRTLSFLKFGDLQLHKGHTLVVSNAEGLCGVIRLRQLSETPVRVVGEWVQSCTWPYLAGGRNTSSNFLESASSTDPDVRGELVCDLIDPVDWHRINPPGVKGLMGATDYDGTIVVNDAGCRDVQRLLGKLDIQGNLYCGQPMDDGVLTKVEWGVGDLRWLEIGSRWEGMTAVRSPESGLWGVVDRSGALAIPAQFDDVRGFDEGRAAAKLAGEPFWGLIDKAGDWILPAKWLDIEPWEKDLIVLEDAEHCWGAVDSQGNTIVDFKSQAEWLLNPVTALLLSEYQAGKAWADNEQGMLRDVVISGIRKIAKEQSRNRMREALSACCKGGFLAGMEGIFNADTSERDLRDVGVWGRQVRLLRDKKDGVLQPVKGEEGRIGCYYPVGLSCFDLSVEAPVNGLPTQPEAAIGIRWRDLEFVDAEGERQFADRTSAWDRLRQAASSATNISAHLLGAVFLFFRLCIVGITLYVILNGIYHIPLVSALLGALCAGYLLWIGFKVVQAILAKNKEKAGEVFVTAYADSRKFFWWNFGGFVVWLLLVLGFKGQIDPWFAPVWAALSSLGVLRMAHRIRGITAPPPKPEWPADIVEKMKAEFRKELEADGESGPCEILCLRSRYYMFRAGVVEDYADRYPAVAFYEEEITKMLDDMCLP